MAYKIYIPQNIEEEGKKYLSDKGYIIKMGSEITEDIMVKEVKDCDAILVRSAQLTERILKAGHKLKVIGKYGVGVDNIDIKAATELRIQVTNGPFSNCNTVAEHTIGIMIALARNLLKCDSELRKGNFAIRNISGIDLEGKTLGILGYGKIGKQVAKKAILGFDMKVIAYVRHINQNEALSQVEQTKDMEYILRNSDFISVHLPYTESTKKIIGEKEFDMMKPTAYFLNVARGEVVDEIAMIRALKLGKIAGAGIDVFEGEIPKRDSPLLYMKNVILTPHNAALTTESTTRMVLQAAMGIYEVLSGKQPSFPVNKI